MSGCNNTKREKKKREETKREKKKEKRQGRWRSVYILIGYLADQ